MKYNCVLLVDILKKKHIKFCFIEVILIVFYLLISQNFGNALKLVFGLNVIDFKDEIMNLIRVLNTCFIIYSTFVIYFFDFYKSPEFVMLRKDKKSILLIRLYLL